MKVILLGAGLQGIATALDLAWNKNIKEIMIADLDLERANYVAKLCNDKYGKKAETMKLDVSDMNALVDAISGYDLVINEVNYYFNCHIMDACLEAKVNYIDIGGLYVETVKQMKYNEKFKAAGLLAIPGIGGTPGLTNVCARWAVDKLDNVESIDIFCACDDWAVSEKTFEVTYAIETIMDEFHMKPIQFLDGKYVEVEPRSGAQMVTYSKPIGDMYSYYIMHSEIGTLPEVYKDKGIKRCTFRIAFAEPIREKLEFLHGLGFSSSEKIKIGDVEVAPVKVLKTLMELQPDDPNATINDCDIIKVVVVGEKEGKRTEYTLEAVCRPVKEWPELLGAQVYIGGAPAWAAEMIRRGEISGTGVLAPEECIPAEEFFEEAAKREIFINKTEKSLLGSDEYLIAKSKETINQEM